MTETRRLHFIAIGGAGMSGLALVCGRRGATVTGSDRAESSYLDRLRQAGIPARVGHEAGNVPPDADVVVSTAIADDNPELQIARERGQRVMHRSELLAELCDSKRLVAIAGTHGKTTTTAMAIWALRELGSDPAFFLGGELPGIGVGGEPANAGWGDGEWVVAEADESDGSFLRLHPEVAVITNLEMDHHSRWGSLAELTEAFRGFTRSASAAVLPEDTTFDAFEAGDAITRFGPAGPGPRELGLAVPGRHNETNARAAIGALEHAGIDPAAAARALGSFPGVRRRLELKGAIGDALVYDDYAHHPTEVRAALGALRGLDPSRLVAVFQPHLYSRTKAMAAEFGAALALADEVVVLDVYAAREEPTGDLAGVSGLLVANATSDRFDGRRVWWLPRHESVVAALTGTLGDGDILVTLGAGDVHRVGEELLAGESG